MYACVNTAGRPGLAAYFHMDYAMVTASRIRECEKTTGLISLPPLYEANGLPVNEIMRKS